MIDFESARRLVLHEVKRPLAMERIVLDRAVGRILGEDLRSSVFLPTSDYSAMDGYAVRADDLHKGETRLPVSGECRTGHPTPAFHAGTCVRIFTGAAIPVGANAVVMQENVRREGEVAVFVDAPAPGAHIRLRGEDLKEGDLVLAEGTRINPFHLSLLASVELSEVLVRRRPVVGILCTGDELRTPGSGASGLAESNSASLAALIEQAGGTAHRGPLIGDDAEILKEALIAQAASSDVVVTVGGVSVGEYDVVASTLLAMGAEIVFHKVKIKPGKPVLLAKWNNTFILGLPGNPSSAQVTFCLLGIPLLRALAGDASPLPEERRVPLKHDLSNGKGRKCFYRGRLGPDGVEILSNQSSGASTTIAWSNSFVIVDEETELVSAGELVSVIDFNDL
jgi:molybdopterin molybdotransferase